MSKEGNRDTVLDNIKVRTKLKPDASWMQPRDTTRPATSEEEKPWLAEVRARRLNGAPTSPISSPVSSTPPPLTADTEIKAPTEGYLIRGVFTKVEKPASPPPPNGISTSRHFSKKPSETYKLIAPHTVRSTSRPEDSLLSPEEQEKRREAASSVLKSSSVRKRSYVLSAAKKYEAKEASPDPSPVENSPSFVAKKVEVNDDEGAAAPAPAPASSASPSPLSAETSAASASPEPKPRTTSSPVVKTTADPVVNEPVIPKVGEPKEETPKTDLLGNRKPDSKNVVTAVLVEVASSDPQSDDSGISDTPLIDALPTLKAAASPAPTSAEPGSAAPASGARETPVTDPHLPQPPTSASTAPVISAVTPAGSKPAVTELAVETKSAPVAEPKPKPEREPEPLPEPKPKPEPKVEPKPEPKVEPQPEPVVPKPKPEPKVEPKSEPVVLKPKPEPKVEPQPEPVVLKPKPEPKVELKFEPVVPKPKPEPKVEPQPEPVVLKPKPEPKVEPQSEPVVLKPKPEPKVEPQPEPELKPETEAKKEPTSESAPKTSSSFDVLTALSDTLISLNSDSSRAEKDPAPLSKTEPLTDDLLGFNDSLEESPVPPSPGRWSQDLFSELHRDLNPMGIISKFQTKTNVAVDPEPSSIREAEEKQTDETAEETQSSADPFDPYPIGTTSHSSPSDLLQPNISISSLSPSSMVTKSLNTEKNNALESLADNIIPINTDTSSSQQPGNTSPPQQTNTEEESSQEAKVEEEEEEEEQSVETVIMFERKSNENNSPWDKWTSPTVYEVYDSEDEEEEEREMQSETQPALDRSVTSSAAVVEEEKRVVTPEPKKGLVLVKEYVNVSENSRDQINGDSDYLTSSSATYSYSSPSNYSRVSHSSTCTYCGEQVGNDAKISIDHLNIHCHPACFKCGECSKPMGDLLLNMFIHAGKVHCDSCYANVI